MFVEKANSYFDYDNNLKKYISCEFYKMEVHDWVPQGERESCLQIH
jgi:hypothetical protein